MRIVTVYKYPKVMIGRAVLQADGHATLEGFPISLRKQYKTEGIPMCRGGRWTKVPLSEGTAFLNALVIENANASYGWVTDTGAESKKKGYPEFDPHEGRDDQGRWSGDPTTHAHVSSDEMSKLIQHIKENGGFTYSALTGEEPEEGFALSVFKGHEGTVPFSDLKPNDLTGYALKNWDLLRQPGNFIGGWHNRDDNKVYLDVSRVVHDQKEAERLASENMQLAYFDLKAGKEHVTNWFGLKGAMKNATKPELTLAANAISVDVLVKLYERLTGRQVTAEELAQMSAQLDAKK